MCGDSFSNFLEKTVKADMGKGFQLVISLIILSALQCHT